MMILMIVISVRIIMILTLFKLQCNVNANFGQSQGLSLFNMGSNYD